ncbi:MAG: tetratricopeptide repeat protein [Chitinophagales bacterium]
MFSKDDEKELKGLYELKAKWQKKRRKFCMAEVDESDVNKLFSIKSSIKKVNSKIEKCEKKIKLLEAKKQEKKEIETTLPINAEKPSNNDIGQAATILKQEKRKIGFLTSKEDIAEMLHLEDKIDEPLNFLDEINFIAPQKKLLYSSALFDKIYTSQKLSSKTVTHIQNIRENYEKYQYYDRSIIVSALSLSLIKFKFDVKKANLLLDFISDGEDKVWQRALIGLMLAILTNNRAWIRYDFFTKRLEKLKNNDEIQQAVKAIEFILRNQLYKFNSISPKLFENELFEDPLYCFLPFYEDNKILQDALENADNDFDVEYFQSFLQRNPFLASHKYMLCTALFEEKTLQKTELNEKQALKRANNFSLAHYFHPFQHIISEFFCFFSYYPKRNIDNFFKKQLLLATSDLKEFILHQKTLLLIEANTAYDKEEYRKARTKYADLLEIDKEHKEAKLKIASCYFNIGNDYKDKGDVDNAIIYFNNAIICKPDLHGALGNMGNTYLRKKEYDKAISYFQKVIDIKPNDYKAWSNMGTAYNDKQEYDKAIKHIQKAIDIKPDFSNSWYNMGNTYIDKQEYDKAIKYFQEAINIKPDFYETWHNMGIAYLHKKDYNEAIKHFQKAISFEENEKSNIILGHICLIQKEQGALNYYQKSLAAYQDKNAFFEMMLTSFRQLKLTEHGISEEYFMNFLAEHFKDFQTFLEKKQDSPETT